MKALFYPIDEAVADYQRLLGFNSDRYGNDIRRWVGQALIELRVQYTFTKETVIPINNLTAILPDDFYRLDELQMIDVRGACHIPYFEDSVIKCCLRTDRCNRSADKRVRASFNFDRFLFSSSISDLDIEKVRITYHTLPTDKGDLVVPVLVNEAVKAFVRWNYLTMKRNQLGDSRGKAGRTTSGDVEMAKRDWFAAKLLAKTNLQNVGEHTLRQVGEAWLFTLGTYPTRRVVAKGN